MYYFQSSRGRYTSFALFTTCIILFTACSVNNSSESSEYTDNIDAVEARIQELQHEQREEFEQLLKPFLQASTSNHSSPMRSMKLISASGYEIVDVGLPVSTYPNAFNNKGSLIASLPYPSYDRVYWNEETGIININEWIESRYETEREVGFVVRINNFNNLDELGTWGGLYFPDGPTIASFIWSPDEGLKLINELTNPNATIVYQNIVEINAINDRSELFGQQYGDYQIIERSLYWNEEDGIVSDPAWPLARINHANNDRLTAGTPDDETGSLSSIILDMNSGTTAYLDQFIDDILASYVLKVTNSGKILWRFYQYENYRSVQRFGYLENDELLIYEQPEGAISYSITSMNDSGKAVGYAFYDDVTNAIIWNPDGSPEVLELNSNAGLFHINDHDELIALIWKDGGYKIHYLTPNESDDITPPAITYTRETESLWPPNHRMETVLTGITATDDQDPEPEILIEVFSNEDENGMGDGHTESDWEVTQADDGTYQVALRAERSGIQNGRTYTVLITATDASGNVAEEEILISVAHDRSVTAR